MDIKAIIKSLVVRMWLKLAGWQAWVADIVFNVVWKKLVKLFKQYENKQKAEKEVDQSLEKYEKIIENPKSSADDIRNAFDDLNRN